MNRDAVARASRWHDFYNEPGGVGDVLRSIRQAYFERSSDLLPSDTSALLKLGIAAKVVDQIDAHIKHIIANGQIEAAARDHADMIAKLPEAARRRF